MCVVVIPHTRPIGEAVSAYFGAANLAAAQAAVAAVGPGYSVNTVDAIDPRFPNALPRALIINLPYVNANYAIASGIDVAATATIPFSDGVKFTSRIEATHIFNMICMLKTASSNMPARSVRTTCHRATARPTGVAIGRTRWSLDLIRSA